MKLILLVGVCGAVPSTDIGEDSDTSIFLGDVIIGTDIVENERFKTDEDVRQEKNLIDQFGSRRFGVRAFVEELELRKEQLESGIRLPQHLCDQIWTGEQSPADCRKIFPSDYRHKNRNHGYRHQQGYNWDYDTLSADLFDEGILLGSDDHYDSADLHSVPERSSCEEMSCVAGFMVSHGPHDRLDGKHSIHFGSICSERYVRSIEDREAITRREGVIGFVSQGERSWHCLPSIMVQGVAHHADGHNFDTWRKYAALVAASATVGLLEHWGRGRNLDRSRRDPFVSIFAGDLLDKAFQEKPETVGLEKLYEALPGLLQTLAIRAKASGDFHRTQEAMELVRKYRYEIMRTLRHKYREQCVLEHELTEVNEATTPASTSSVLFGNHLKYEINETTATPPGETLKNEPFGDMSTLSQSLPQLSVYCDFIIDSPAYKWLLGDIQKILCLSLPQDKSGGIGQAIIEYLPRSKWSGTPQRHSMMFTAKWDPRLFLREREYPDDPENALERALTITGSITDAQAATTTQYMKQTWPSTGHHFLRIMQDFVRTELHTPCTCEKRLNLNFTAWLTSPDDLPDGTRMKVSTQGSRFTIEVTGIVESIAEIGDQFVWLVAAFHSPVDDTRVNIVHASVSEIKSPEITKGPSVCTIEFGVEVVYHTPARLNEQCWQKLFGGPVIVGGYPIPRRPRDGVGLEISLDTMADLSGTDRINIFRDQIYIKAFAMMLFPTRYFDNIILWHLLWSDGPRVSYLASGHA
ncbi:hypothetical protein BJX62DRAFT_182958 [Aspergillus germanicus]